MDQKPQEMPAPPHDHPPEKPGWTAILLIVAFVLAAVLMYLVGARLVKRTAASHVSSIVGRRFVGLASDPGGASFGAGFASPNASLRFNRAGRY
jgi:hypothetical protein